MIDWKKRHRVNNQLLWSKYLQVADLEIHLTLYATLNIALNIKPNTNKHRLKIGKESKSLVLKKLPIKKAGLIRARCLN